MNSHQPVCSLTSLRKSLSVRVAADKHLIQSSTMHDPCSSPLCPIKWPRQIIAYNRPDLFGRVKYQEGFSEQIWQIAHLSWT